MLSKIGINIPDDFPPSLPSLLQFYFTTIFKILQQLISKYFTEWCIEWFWEANMVISPDYACLLGKMQKLERFEENMQQNLNSYSIQPFQMCP